MIGFGVTAGVHLISYLQPPDGQFDLWVNLLMGLVMGLFACAFAMHPDKVIRTELKPKFSKLGLRVSWTTVWRSCPVALRWGSLLLFCYGTLVTWLFTTPGPAGYTPEGLLDATQLKGISAACLAAFAMLAPFIYHTGVARRTVRKLLISEVDR